MLLLVVLPLFVFRRHPEPSAKDPRILHDATGANSAHQPSTFVWAPPSGCATTNAGVLQLRFRMTTKNKQQQQQRQEQKQIPSRSTALRANDKKKSKGNYNGRQRG
jgi:hypothetical protein